MEQVSMGTRHQSSPVSYLRHRSVSALCSPQHGQYRERNLRNLNKLTVIGKGKCNVTTDSSRP